MTDRDTFAAAALTGFIRGTPDNSIFHLGLISQQAYEVADAMLCERDNHSEKPNSSPTLTNEEREAVEWYAGFVDGIHAATLRNLLERLK